ncbi:MAG TPA: TlpA disulfide reductase family protein [Fimbriimonadaceae bacterium]|nr:TlpA disulfide reductase family protein [Fimbriimonadaceae bacterium]
MRPLVTLTYLAALAFSASASASTLKPGSTPPALDVKTWYKGAPVTSFDADKTYVVEFWATWCGPCRESIPHLTELAKSNPDVTFVGVSIWEDDNGSNIADFVKKMGDKMDYHVGYSGNQTGMAKSWMSAAGQNGIPTAFVVKNNTVEWIGHPMELAKPLSEIKSGTFDLAGFTAKYEKRQAEQEAQMAVQKDLSACVALYKHGKKDEAKAKLDALVKAHPTAETSADSIRFDWLANDDPAAWKVKAQAMADSKDDEKLQGLCVFALRDGSGKTPAHLDLDRQAIQMALKATNGSNVVILYDAENFFEATKDYQQALDAAQAFLKALPSSPYKDNKDLAKMMEDKTKVLTAKIKS